MMINLISRKQETYPPILKFKEEHEKSTGAKCNSNTKRLTLILTALWEYFRRSSPMIDLVIQQSELESKKKIFIL